MNKKVVITLIILIFATGAYAKEKVSDYKNAYILGQYNKTYELCIKALKQNHSDYKAHYYLGLYYLQKGQLNDAKAHFKNVITIAPGTKLASYSASGIQNIYEEQNKEFEVDSVKIASASSSSRKSSKPVFSRVSSVSKRKADINLEDGENYFFNAVNNDGKILRWDPNYPINIYIPNDDMGYETVIKEAFNAWKSAYGKFKFEYTKNPSIANLNISFMDNFHQFDNKYDKAGEAKPIVKSGLLKRFDINLKTTDDKGEKLHPAIFYNTVVHEIGHALGICGHSDNKEDVMFPVSMAVTRRFMLSERDKNTIKALYKSDADITNRKRDSGKSTVLSSNKSLKESSKEAKIKEAKQYAQMMPNDPANWIKLGYTYETYGQPQDALESYAKAIVIEPENVNALKNTASVYFKMKKYPNAIQVYKKLIKIEPRTVDFYRNLALCYEKMERYDDSIYWLDRAVKQNPKAKNDKKIEKLRSYIEKKKGK